MAADAPACQDTAHNANIPPADLATRAKAVQAIPDSGTRAKVWANCRHSYADRGLDAYWTPPEAVQALLRVESLPMSIADPCCGSGAILDVLKGAGYIIHGSDIEHYGWPYTVVRDYLAAPVVMNDVGVVTNPPYRLAIDFIKKAISDRTIYHAWLLRLNFLESIGRKAFWDEHPLTRLHIFSRRLPMMHRISWEGPKSSSNIPFAWFVFDHRVGVSDTRPQINHVDWNSV